MTAAPSVRPLAGGRGDRNRPTGSPPKKNSRFSPGFFFAAGGGKGYKLKQMRLKGGLHATIDARGDGPRSLLAPVATTAPGGRVAVGSGGGDGRVRRV